MNGPNRFLWRGVTIFAGLWSTAAAIAADPTIFDLRERCHAAAASFDRLQTQLQHTAQYDVLMLQAHAASGAQNALCSTADTVTTVATTSPKYQAYAQAMREFALRFAQVNSTAKDPQMSPCWGNVERTFRLLAEVYHDTKPLTGSFAHNSYLGAIQYHGGFLKDATLAMTVKADVERFQISVPAFCKGVEISEVTTISNGVRTPAKVVDAAKALYQVAGRASVEGISATLNGPAGLSCTLPIYLRDANSVTPPPNGPATDPTQTAMQLCNDTRAPIAVAVAWDDAAGSSQGWLRIPRRRCVTANLIVPTEPNLTNVYIHGVDTQGHLWGHDKAFCVDPRANGFQLNNSHCSTAPGSFQSRLFTAHARVAGQLMQVRFSLSQP